ncbi:prephenate dehydratase [Corynebacterium diphtheriae]|nr:prephenate dehydratase [Corynebacterium diphtheriae]
MRIAYLGPEGTFTEAALWKFATRLGLESVNTIAATNPREAIAAVAAGQADYACVAIETPRRPVTPTFDALATIDGVRIFHELDLPIAFAIMQRTGAPLRRFATHPVAYQQVKTWLAANAPAAEFVPASSNAEAARMAKEKIVDFAAAPARAADVYGLNIIADGVADVTGARTRFVLVGHADTPTPRTGHDRTSVVFTLKNEPGSLVGALSEFAMRGVDLTRIESRPIEEGLETYRFHVDINGHIDDLNVAEALRALYPRCNALKFIGSWPAISGQPVTAVDPTVAQAASAWVEAARNGA